MFHADLGKLYETWLTPATGFAFVLLAAVAYLLDRGVTGTVEAEEFVAYYDLHATAVQWQVYLFALGGLPFLTHYADLSQRFEQAAPRQRYVSGMILSGAGATLTLQLLWCATRLVLTQEAALGPTPAFFVISQLGNAAATLTSFTAAVIVAGVSVGVLGARLLPAPYGQFGLGLLVLLLVNGFLQVQSAGDWDGLGEVTFFTFLTWALVGALLLIRTKTRDLKVSG